MASTLSWIFGISVALLYLVGAASALDAIMKTRTAQGATAWAISLLTMPLLALPLYWIFGRSKFDDYARALRQFDKELDDQIGDPREEGLVPFYTEAKDQRGECQAFNYLSTVRFTRGNDAHLLIDGPDTFQAIFAAIDGAEKYLLAQFYILRDDETGRTFKQKLCARARAGVRVHLLYDEVGAHGLPRRYLQELEDAGVIVSGFTGHRNWLGRFRLNFRNHRKLLIADGLLALTGGHNIGDEYVDGADDFPHWRDTFVELRGPVVQGLQVAFMKDWFFSKRELLDLEWTPTPADADRQGLVQASGPIDELETCGLLFKHAIETARERFWIATPYFVPDGRVLAALQIAAARGVDVRILVPRKSDNILFKYVPYAFLGDVMKVGCKVYFWEKGFMHQKAFLVDDLFAGITTANLDNRSFRLNFELTVLMCDRPFAQEVAAMLESDLNESTLLSEEDLSGPDAPSEFAVQVTRLFAPVL